MNPVEYAEKHGIIEYHTIGNTMIFYSSFPMEHMTYTCAVDLATGKETRKELSRYYVAYKGKIAGKYYANYCA